MSGFQGRSHEVGVGNLGAACAIATGAWRSSAEQAVGDRCPSSPTAVGATTAGGALLCSKMQRWTKPRHGVVLAPHGSPTSEVSLSSLPSSVASFGMHRYH